MLSNAGSDQDFLEHKVDSLTLYEIIFFYFICLEFCGGQMYVHTWTLDYTATCNSKMRNTNLQL